MFDWTPLPHVPYVLLCRSGNDLRKSRLNISKDKKEIKKILMVKHMKLRIKQKVPAIVAFYSTKVCPEMSI